MKVRAKRMGTYPPAIRRREGAEFELESPKHFNEKWMEKLEQPKPKRSAPAKAEPEADAKPQA